VNLRLRLATVSILLCLALTTTVFAATRAVNSFQKFQQAQQMVNSGNVETLDSWMTLPYISRVYHVPQYCLAHYLHITSFEQEYHATLLDLAHAKNIPYNSFRNNMSAYILHYRAHKSICVSNVAPGSPVHLPPHNPPSKWWGRLNE
jgi:hypothetical protein